MSLRDNVEALLPEWERWYPSLFDAAADLGLIRPRVCAPSSLLLSRRHSAIRDEAIRAFRERWNAADPEQGPPPQAGRDAVTRRRDRRPAGGKRRPSSR